MSSLNNTMKKFATTIDDFLLIAIVALLKSIVLSKPSTQHDSGYYCQSWEINAASKYLALDIGI